MKIETATIRRLRDSLLSSGRRAQPIRSSAYEILTREGLLSQEENAALKRVDSVAETLFLVMAADGSITEEEETALIGAVRDLTSGVLHDGTVRVMLERYARTLEKQGRERRLEELGKAFSGNPADAEGAFTLAAAVALADEKLVDAERDLIRKLSVSFGIKSDRVAVILGQLEEDRAALETE